MCMAKLTKNQRLGLAEFFGNFSLIWFAAGFVPVVLKQQGFDLILLAVTIFLSLLFFILMVWFYKG